MDTERREDDTFKAVLKILNLDRVPSLALAVRQFGHSLNTVSSIDPESSEISCQVDHKYVCGSFNMLFPITFNDGKMWMLKIPSDGHEGQFNEAAAEGLKSEALTMRMIKRETTIPVPEVYAFDASLNNELGCPYILMEHLPGRPLYCGWFEEGVSQEKLNRFRAKALQDLADAMTQLNKFTFKQGGSLIFDDNGNVAGMGSTKTMHLFTQMQAMRHAKEDEDIGFAYCNVGPFDKPKDSMLALVDRRGGDSDGDKFGVGVYILFRLLIDLAFEDTHDAKNAKFVLTHPDCDTQNIMTLADGSVSGIIDWDWVAAVPHAVGCQAYPKFLIHDYITAEYAWDDKKGKPMKGHDECSPQELACYRELYAKSMEISLEKDFADRIPQPSLNDISMHRYRQKQKMETTRGSLLTGALQRAADSPGFTHAIVANLFEVIQRITAAQWEPESSDSSSEDSDGSGTTASSSTDATEHSDTENAGQPTGFHARLRKLLKYGPETPHDKILAELHDLTNTATEVFKRIDDAKAQKLADADQAENEDVKEAALSSAGTADSEASGKVPFDSSPGTSILEPDTCAEKPENTCTDDNRQPSNDPLTTSAIHNDAENQLHADELEVVSEITKAEETTVEGVPDEGVADVMDDDLVDDIVAEVNALTNSNAEPQHDDVQVEGPESSLSEDHQGENQEVLHKIRSAKDNVISDVKGTSCKAPRGSRRSRIARVITKPCRLAHALKKKAVAKLHRDEGICTMKEVSATAKVTRFATDWTQDKVHQVLQSIRSGKYQDTKITPSDIKEIQQGDKKSFGVWLRKKLALSPKKKPVSNVANSSGVAGRTRKGPFGGRATAEKYGVKANMLNDGDGAIGTRIMGVLRKQDGGRYDHAADTSTSSIVTKFSTMPRVTVLSPSTPVAVEDPQELSVVAAAAATSIRAHTRSNHSANADSDDTRAKPEESVDISTVDRVIGETPRLMQQKNTETPVIAETAGPDTQAKAKGEFTTDVNTHAASLLQKIASKALDIEPGKDRAVRHVFAEQIRSDSPISNFSLDASDKDSIVLEALEARDRPSPRKNEEDDGGYGDDEGEVKEDIETANAQDKSDIKLRSEVGDAQTDHAVDAVDVAGDDHDSAHDEGEEDVIYSTDDVIPSVEDINPSVEDLPDYESDTEPTPNLTSNRASISINPETQNTASNKGKNKQNDNEKPEETEEEKAAREKQEYHETDHGAFDLYDVAMALVDSSMDEKRMRRLRDGFFKLLHGT